MIFSRDRTNYPLDVSVDDIGTGFGLVADAVAPADPGLVCALVHTAAAGLIAALEHAPGTPLRQVPVLDEAERWQLVAGWNDTAVPVPAGTLVQLLAAQAGRSPDAVAVACGDVALSYAGLWARAGRVAGLLAGSGPGRSRWWRSRWTGRRSWWRRWSGCCGRGRRTCRWIRVIRPGGPGSCWLMRARRRW